jgi:hypothetical protein
MRHFSTFNRFGIFFVHLHPKTKIQDQMKKFLLFILTIPFVAFGQSLEIVAYDSVVFGHYYSSPDIYGHASVKNNAAYNIEVRVKRYYDPGNDLVSRNAICWGMCFDETVDVSPFAITIANGATNTNDFNGHVYPPQDTVARTGQVTYTFYDENNPSDSVSMTVTYVTTATFSVYEQEAQKISFKVYPNPAKDVVWIDMQNIKSSNVSIVVNDVIGNNILEKNIRNYGNREQIDIGGLRAGFYFFSMYDNGKLIGTKRIQVIQ